MRPEPHLRARRPAGVRARARAQRRRPSRRHGASTSGSCCSSCCWATAAGSCSTRRSSTTPTATSTPSARCCATRRRPSAWATAAPTPARPATRRPPPSCSRTGRATATTAGSRVEEAVHKMTQATATLYGLGDRGVLAPGFVGDVNVIDYDRLQLRRPELVDDLPGGASRLVQQADGYVAHRQVRACAPSSAARTPAPAPARCSEAPGERTRPRGGGGVLGRPLRPRLAAHPLVLRPGLDLLRRAHRAVERRRRARTASRRGCASGWRAWWATSTAPAWWPRAPTASWSPSTPRCGPGRAARRWRCPSCRCSASSTATIVLWKDYWDLQTLMGAAPAAWHERLDTADLSWVVDVTGRA